MDEGEGLACKALSEQRMKQMIAAYPFPLEFQKPPNIYSSQTHACPGLSQVHLAIAID